jgi:hypothetical protein
MNGIAGIGLAEQVFAGIEFLGRAGRGQSGRKNSKTMIP